MSFRVDPTAAQTPRAVVIYTNGLRTRTARGIRGVSRIAAGRAYKRVTTCWPMTGPAGKGGRHPRNGGLPVSSPDGGENGRVRSSDFAVSSSPAWKTEANRPVRFTAMVRLPRGRVSADVGTIAAAGRDLDDGDFLGTFASGLTANANSRAPGDDDDHWGRPQTLCRIDQGG